MALGEVAGDFKSSSKYALGVGYNAGKFAAAATWDRQNGAGTSTTPADSTDYIQGIHAGASYAFGDLKLFAGYRNYKRQSRFNETTRLSIDKNFKSDMYKQCDGNWACKRTADIYYKAVREFGASAASTASSIEQASLQQAGLK